MSAVNLQCITRADNAIVSVGYPVLHYVPGLLLKIPGGVVDLKV
jgi:hypothetical protein